MFQHFGRKDAFKAEGATGFDTKFPQQMQIHALGGNNNKADGRLHEKTQVKKDYGIL